MNDLMPPARRSIPEPRRTRIRSQLDAEMHAAGRRDSAARRFGIPFVAAAAVVALAIGGYVVANGDNGSQRDKIAPTDQRPKPPADDKQEKKHEQATGPGPSEPVDDPAQAHQQCVRLARTGKAPAGQLAIENDKGTTVVVADSTNAFTCNIEPDRAVSNPRPLDARVVPATFAVANNVTSNVLPGDPGDMVWGGGALPHGVTSITYVFPDGHEEPAVTKNGYWAMQYFSPAPFDAAGDPIEVRLDGPGGPRELTLEWGIDTCNQVSHGC